MKKLQPKKLQLRRETVSTLTAEDLEDVAVGRPCITSGQTTSIPLPSVCIC